MDVTSVFHHLHGLGQIDLGRDQFQQVVEEKWLLFKVEDNGSVIQVVVRDVDDVLREQIVSKCSWRVLHHALNSLVLLVID